MKHLSRIVTKFSIFDAWIVGSAAAPDCNYETVRDIDVLVPFSHWKEAALLIPPDAKPNTFGGWKFVSDGKEIDVWPGELGWVMSNAAAKWALHLKSGTRITKI